MARYIGPKLKKRQRFGLADESASIRRKNVRLAKKSDYGLILEEKQKLKFVYGIMERQMNRYAREAFASPENTQTRLLQILESRLDNVVFRLGLAKTREQARQFVNHGHVSVDGRRVGIPSYSLRPGQEIALSPKIVQQNVFKDLIENLRQSLPESGFLLRTATGGRFLNIPQDLDLPKDIDMAKVIEFYHRKI